MFNIVFTTLNIETLEEGKQFTDFQEQGYVCTRKI